MCKAIGRSGWNRIGLSRIFSRFLVMCLERGVLFRFTFSRSGAYIGSCGDWETAAKNDPVKVILRYFRGGSAASAHRLIAGLVRNAPSAVRSAEF